VRKVDVPFVGWDIGALCEVAQIAEIALIDYLAVVGNIDAIHFKSWAFIYQVEQCWKCIAETYTASAAMTYVIDTL
jgi:hypothetical protein